MTEEDRQKEWSRLSGLRVSAAWLLVVCALFIVANISGATGEGYSHTLTGLMLIGVVGSGIYIFDATRKMNDLSRR